MNAPGHIVSNPASGPAALRSPAGVHGETGPGADTRRVLGIDPGACGALACLTLIGEVVGVWDYPGSPACLWSLIAEHYLLRCELAAVEHVHAMPGQGVTSMFSFGVNFGVWQGVAAVLGWPLVMVTPQAWRKVALDSSVPKKPSKKDLGAYAQRRWPGVEIIGPRGGVKDGRAEALCIAEYARQRVVGK